MMAHSEHPAPQRSAALRWALLVCALLAFAGFCALGTWQVKRLAWKRDLIAHVDQRVAAPAVEAPVTSAWAGLSADADAYRKVRISGTYLNEHSASVMAVTDLGPGFWLMTPLRRDDGSIVFINRGYIPGKPAVAAPEGRVTVIGLLRLNEPKGAFLHENVPAQDQWYSRDVLALAAARGLVNSAPYFIDAAAGQERAVTAVPTASGASASSASVVTSAAASASVAVSPPASDRTAASAKVPSTSGTAAASVPVGGLTIIRFPNSHLVYALTWFGLAAMVAAAAAWALRDHRRSGGNG